jgi:hypothetical protein
MLICEAIQKRVLLEFDYGGFHRVVESYCHGTSTTDYETLRASRFLARAAAGCSPPASSASELRGSGR